ncbi:hypothetical protein [Actinoplanes sp. NPDC049265]|uniref:hypothetical protein n=1 Tax=Actinoplanes sp. NPDC049265 TaxID=3363902 RepID=UPI00371632B8
MTVATRRRTLAGLVPALLAGALLLFYGPPAWTEKHQPVRTTAEQAWPGAARADLPGFVSDGPLFQPLLFLDVHTAVGTAPTPDGSALRLLIRDPDGTLRQLRRLPAASGPRFEPVTTDGAEIFWAETTDQRHEEIWAAPLRGGQPRRLTGDTGAALFYGNQYDLVVAAGRLYWTAGADAERTEIRSVALTGGPVRVRVQPGRWALSAWPWLTDDAGRLTGATRLFNLVTGRETAVAATATETLSCGPTWCRAMVLSSAGLERIDLLHPDGTGRRRIAGGDARVAVTDVALLDRFEILSEGGPGSDLTGTAALLAYDLSTGDTVTLAAAAGAAFTHNGILWWSTGPDDKTVWHSVDLRTA